MKLRGCAGNLLYIFILFLAFGASTYFWFTFFVKGKSVETPNMIGRPLAAARALGSDAGLLVVHDQSGEQDRHSEKVPKGAVVWQNRPPGSLVKRGTKLVVGASLGPLVLTIPDLQGETPRTALLRFAQRNLRLADVAYVDLPEANGIIAEDPPRGTTVQEQTAVSLLVGVPVSPPSWVMPDLIDRSFDLVRATFDAHGLTITNVRYERYPGVSDGTVIRQFPLPGSPVNARDAITLVVSRQEQPTISSDTVVK
ncbi:MAG: PASTA domain-containing protein [Thermoanaerobaculia bacterium]